MITISEKDKKTLKLLGRTNYGPEVIAMFNGLMTQADSVADITGDYGAQVEGRKICRHFISDIIEALTVKDRQFNRIGEDDWS